MSGKRKTPAKHIQDDLESSQNPSHELKKTKKTSQKSLLLHQDLIQEEQKQIQEFPSEKRIWTISYNGTEQKLGFYLGTQVPDILRTIRTFFSFSDDQELLFFDEDDLLITLSSAIPSNTKLFLRKKVPIDLYPLWFWLPPKGSYNQERKNNNRTVFQPQKGIYSYCFGAWIMRNGQHYFTLQIEPLESCVQAGIEAAKRVDQLCPNLKFLSSIKLKELFQEEEEKRSSYEVGFFVDMDKKILKVTDHSRQNILAVRSFPFDFVRPAVKFKHPVSITIKEPNLPIPNWAQ